MGRKYGECIIAPERNNTGYATITELKRIYDNIYVEINLWTTTEKPANKLGWHTNSKTKPEMFFSLQKDYNDKLIKVLDSRLVDEMKAYSQNDLLGAAALTTRHFDLLTAACICWQMRNHAQVETTEQFEELELNETL